MTGAGLLLQGGTVFDGLGSPGRVADVAVLDRRVVAVGGDPPAGLRRVDCRDRYVAPGFVDTHAHSDLVHLLEEPQPFKLLQGVTTEVVGNCGLTFAPLDPASAEVAGQLWSGLAAGVPIEPWGFGELAGRLDRAGPANNLALLVGHGTLRLTANGLDERLRPGAAERMAALAAGSRSRASMSRVPPAATAGGSSELSTVAPASYGYWSPWASTPSSRAAASRSSSSGPLPWAARPAALQCDTWSRTPAALAIVTASSRAASRWAPSSRMCVA